MNTHNMVLVLREVAGNRKQTNKMLSEATGLSPQELEVVLDGSQQRGLISNDGQGWGLTPGGQEWLQPYKVDNAIILAAGFGSRAVPLTYETPKGLLPVKGTPMLEREIEQLIERGITSIVIVVGYMKEAFDYLIDKYGVKLIYNPDYATKNNFASLYRAINHLRSSYVLVADNWIEQNMFHSYEPDSWFSCLYFEGETHEWCVDVDSDGRINEIHIGGADSLAVVGPAYFSAAFSDKFRALLEEYYRKPGSADFYWEHILRDHIDELPMYVNEQTGNLHEFENLEELRQYDTTYIDNTRNKIMEFIAESQNVSQGSIDHIVPLKAGVTNHSFKFDINDRGYVFRLPGYGTDKLINRANEKATYLALGDLGIADEIVLFDEKSGIKISTYYPNSTIADPFSDEDLYLSMTKIKQVHDQSLRANHSYDLASMIRYYYKLADEIHAIRFRDVQDVLEKVEELLRLKDAMAIPEVLCHGDYAHTNVLKLSNGDIRLIDWEYSGMADPMMDVSMYTIYAQFDKARIDLAVEYYLGRKPTQQEAVRLYMYVALGGFLWSMWGQYKQGLGQEFGEYPMIMYRYMKDYYRIVQEMLLQ